MGVAHLYIIAEHIVESYFKWGNTRSFALSLLNLHQVVFAGVGNLSQRIQLLVNPFSNISAFIL